MQQQLVTSREVYPCTDLTSSQEQVGAGDTSVPPDLIVSPASPSSGAAPSLVVLPEWLSYTPRLGIGRAGDGMNDTSQRTAEFLAVIIENRELRQQLAETQEQCVELAVDAGQLHAEIEALRARLAQAKKDRDAWRAEAEQGRRTG